MMKPVRGYKDELGGNLPEIFDLFSLYNSQTGGCAVGLCRDFL